MLKFWQDEEVFLDGDQYFERLLKDIDMAQSYITIEMYIFNDDLLGHKIIEHLLAANARGVKIQIIVDGIGSYHFFEKLHGIFSDKKISVKMYNPLPFYHPYYGKMTLLRKLQVLMVRLWRMNKRNHRKIITIDNKIMYAGSFNFTAESTRFFMEKAWKDMGVRVTGDNVQFAVLNFKKVWKLRDYYRFKKHVKKNNLPQWKQFPLRLNQTIFMKSYFYKDFLKKINHAKDRIWLTTPYFIPKRRLIRLLGKAAKRGVDVRILISLDSDVKVFKFLQYFYYPYLLKKGVKVYHYMDTVLHAKSYIIDNWITIGSSNLNHRSFLHDLEFDLVIQDEKNIKIIEENFIVSTKPHTMVTSEALKARSLKDKLLSRLMFLFKYWF